MKNLEKEINTQQNVASVEEINALKLIVEEIENIKQIVSSSQKNIITEKRLVIFPQFSRSVTDYFLIV